MRGERALLRLGESLVRRACRRLSGPTRDDRYREWAAELPAILHDPGIRLAPHRAFRMLAYAADTLRGAALTPGPARRPARSWAILFSTAGLILMAWSIWELPRPAWFFMPSWCGSSDQAWLGPGLAEFQGDDPDARAAVRESTHGVTISAVSPGGILPPSGCELRAHVKPGGTDDYRQHHDPAMAARPRRR
jgi:hypothetical protein